MTGTFRFELTKGKVVDRWHVSVEKGDVTGSHGGGAADCIVRASRAVFDRLASGELNGVAAVLRGELVAEGNWKLLVTLPAPLSWQGSERWEAFPRGRRDEVVVNDGLVKILDGNTFVVSSQNGDIEASLTDPTGLFSFDTRFLAK